MTEPDPTHAARRRVALAVAAVVLLVVVGIVVVGSIGGGQTTAAAPAKCVKAWNRDSVSQGTGAHAATGHGYEGAWVLYLGDDFERNPEDGGSCTVVFPAPQLDPEPTFAAAILVRDRWRPLSELPETSNELVGELQRDAIQSANAALFPDGSLASR